jgi:hypothetical protein
VFSSGQHIVGLGSRLIQACIDEAKRTGNIGVASIVSNGPWMAGKKIFLKNGFIPVAERDRFELVAYTIAKGGAPRFRDISQNAAAYRGLHIVFSDQCPMLSKSAHDLSGMAEEYGLKLHTSVLKSAHEAQNAPSHYGAFSLLWNGRLLSDHYVSKGRFKSIVRKEILD